MIIYILLALASFLLGLFLKDYLPSYIKKKGENLATKEDIAEITHRTEEVKQEFQKEFATFSGSLKFRNDYANEQYTHLYSKIYPIIIQSEYCRQFIQNVQHIEAPFDKIPYVQISPTIRQTTTFREGSISRTEERTETDISETNKKKLYELIIENSQYASQELLKIAVAYRFVYSLYGPNAEDGINEEELRLLKIILIRAVKEYNEVRKTLQLDFNESELSTGMLNSEIIKK